MHVCEEEFEVVIDAIEVTKLKMMRMVIKEFDDLIKFIASVEDMSTGKLICEVCLTTIEGEQ